MSPGYLMGLDLGGGGVRCLLLDVESGAVAIARHAVVTRVAPDTNGLGVDLDLASVERGLAAATREALLRADATPGQVLGIAATSMRLGAVVLDRDGAAILATPNRDARAIGPGLVLASQHGDALLQVMGRFPFPIFAAARLRWLVESQPEALARAAHFFSISDWMTWFLCGEARADRSQAAESLLFGIAERNWAWEWIDELEIPRRLFPELCDPGTVVGTLTEPAAAALGLRVGTPVCAGGGDTQCGLLGTGAIAPGDAAVIGGTTAPVMQVCGAATIDPQGRVWSGLHVLPDRWVLESNAGPVGDTLDWFGRILYPDAPASLGGAAMLLAEADASEPGAFGLTSSLGVEVMNGREQRVPIGNLTLSHMSTASDPAPRRHLARSIVEGIACGLRANLDQLTEITGSPANGPVRFAGGLSRSETLGQVLADVLGAPVEVSAVPDATAFGAALCAAVGAGVATDLEAAAREHVPAGRVRTPDPDTAEAHAEVFERWSRLRAERREADRSAAALATPFALAAKRAAGETSGSAFRPRILVTADCDAESLAALRALGDVEYASFRDKKRMLTGPALVAAVAGFHVFVTEIDLVDADALSQLPDLRVIVSCRGDAVNVDVDACTAFGVPMLRTPGRNADAVADLTLAFLLMLARKLPGASAFLRGPDIAAGDMGKMGQAFGQFRGRELWRKTIGLVGLGAVGSQVCRRLSGFGCRVLVADPYVNPARVTALGAEFVSLDELLRASDFVSLHAAVTPETTGMLGAAEFAAMKPGAFLVNSARAALLDEDALVAALESGRLGGAALDTFSVEPPGSDHPLMAFDNVIATPHVGGNTEDVAAHQGEIVVGELTRLLAGEAPRFAVNPAVLTAFDWNAPRRTPGEEELDRLRAGPAPAVTDLQKKEKGEKRKTRKWATPAT